MGFQSSSSESRSEEHEKETGEQWGREALFFPSPYGLDLSSQELGTALAGVMGANTQTEALFGANADTNKDALNEFRRMIGMPGLDPFLEIKDALNRPKEQAAGFLNQDWTADLDSTFQTMDDVYGRLTNETDPTKRQDLIDQLKFVAKGARNRVAYNYYTGQYYGDPEIYQRAARASYAKHLYDPEAEIIPYEGFGLEYLPKVDELGDLGGIDDPNKTPGWGPDTPYAMLSQSELNDIINGGTGGYIINYDGEVEKDELDGRRNQGGGGGLFGWLFGGLFDGLFGGGQDEGNPGGEDHEATDAALGRGGSPTPTGLFGGLLGAGAYDSAIDYEKYEKYANDQRLGRQLKNNLEGLVRQIERYENEPLEQGYTGDEITEIIRSTPGYEFKLDEGQRLLQNAAATRGELYSGRTGTALQDYGQTMADSEYYNRLNTLAGMAGMTMPALSQTAASAQNAATQAGVAYNALGQNAIDQNRFWHTSPWTSYGYQQRQRDAESESSSSSFGVSL